MGTRPIRAIGQFCWQDADVGVECRRCGWVRVFCDWEMERSFRERGWSTALDAVRDRLRCPCGSGEVRLTPVPMWKRPRPIPARPEPLRPIYAADARSLVRRARPSGVEEVAALETIRAAVDAYPRPVGVSEQVRAAAGVLRPLVYHAHYVDDLLQALGKQPDVLVKRQAVDEAFGQVIRQLGRRER